MSHECPYCGAELVWEDSFGKGNLAAQEKYGYGWEKIGNIYRCPNHQGFDNLCVVEEYINGACNSTTIEEVLVVLGLDSWEDIVCDSSFHHVSGSFYDYGDGTELHNGYPC